MNMLAPKEIPGWLSLLNDQSLLNTKDVALIFGYSTAEDLCEAISKQRFPKPVRRMGLRRGFGRVQSTHRIQPVDRRYYWTKSEVIAEIHRRQALKQNKQSLGGCNGDSVEPGRAGSTETDRRESC